MMANEHMCDANGATSEDGGEEEEEKDDEDATETQDLMLEEEEAHLRSASKTHADLDSGEVDKCYQEWLQSAVAAKVNWPANSNARTREKAKEISKFRIPNFPNF